jgi:hypothetical protein
MERQRSLKRPGKQHPAAGGFERVNDRLSMRMDNWGATDRRRSLSNHNVPTSGHCGSAHTFRTPYGRQSRGQRLSNRLDNSNARGKQHPGLERATARAGTSEG